MKSMRAISLFSLLVVLTLSVFQNCGRPMMAGEGNGQGYGGYVPVPSTGDGNAPPAGAPPSGAPPAGSISFVDKESPTCADHSDFAEITLTNGSYLLKKDNCIAISPPVPVMVEADGQGQYITYDHRVFVRQ